MNSFVRRQVKSSGKTYSTLSFEKIAIYAESQLKDENYNTESIKYYAEIDNRMRAKFPSYFQNDSTPFIESGIKTSFKQIAEKIGSKK